MPYSTRQKSLSLLSLDIQLPVTLAKQAAAQFSPKQKREEVDLSIPGFENDKDIALTPTGLFSGHSEIISTNYATLPPLEKDEKEFMEIAKVMQKRAMKTDVEINSDITSEIDYSILNLNEDSLFGTKVLAIANTIEFISSPATLLSINSLERGKQSNEYGSKSIVIP